MALEDIDDLLETTLDNYLLALAQGIQEAQRHLDTVEVPGRPGQPATGYHLPRVEFELKMQFAMRGEQPGEDGQNKSASRGQLLLRPASKPTSESFSGEAISTIRGAFVAVPVTGGRAASVLRCSLVRRGPREVALIAFVADALGNSQAGAPIQANVDRERSAELSPGGTPLTLETDLTVGLIHTDAKGFAETTLRIAEAEPAGAIVVIVVDGPGASETLMIQAP